MALDREALIVALWDRLRARIPGIVAWRRENVPPGEAREQPAIYMVQTSEQPEYQTGMPPIWTLEVSVAALVTRQREDRSPDTALNEIIRAMESALEIQPDETQDIEGEGEANTTLGGRALRCWISGEVVRLQGEATLQFLAVVPVTITAYEH